jgi:ferritin
MLSSKMEKALNGQINAELYSSYLYLSMAACFEAANFAGMAQWMRAQAEEEKMHAMKFFDFIVDRGGRVTLTAIDAPETEWDSPLAAFEAAYAHEQKVTGLINDLVKLARSENDAATDTFLQWFVTEQVEEEKNADGIVQKLKMVKDAPHGLLMMDSELGQRQPPAPGGAEGGE